MQSLGMPYPTTVGVVAGGDWASNVMASLRAEARVGVALGETVAAAEQRFTQGILAAIVGDPWLGEHPPRVVRTGAAFGSSSIPPDDPLVEEVRRSAEAVTGRRPELVAAPYGCDMALWTRVGGARCLVYGPGDVRRAHSADEYVSISQTFESADVLVEVVRSLSR
jgi:acetylornithine deacetylase